MTTEVATVPVTPEPDGHEERSLQLEEVVIKGDLSSLTPIERLRYYSQVCKSLGLNPLTKPFLYITFDRGKGLQLYATRDCTDQLRSIRGISITDLNGRVDDDIYVVICKGTDRTGRTDMATGAVPYGNLRGEARANAIMKAETKAKRRMTLSLAGLGWLDEVEVESIEETDAVNVDPATGEILPSTWEGRVAIGSKLASDLEPRYTGSDLEGDHEYEELAGGPGIEYIGFKLMMPQRKQAQVVLFADATEQLYEQIVDTENPDAPPQLGDLIIGAGDTVRVTGHLSFVPWDKDGRQMPAYRRIVAQTVEVIDRVQREENEPSPLGY